MQCTHAEGERKLFHGFQPDRLGLGQALEKLYVQVTKSPLRNIMPLAWLPSFAPRSLSSLRI